MRTAVSALKQLLSSEPSVLFLDLGESSVLLGLTQVLAFIGHITTTRHFAVEEALHGISRPSSFTFRLCHITYRWLTKLQDSFPMESLAVWRSKHTERAQTSLQYYRNSLSRITVGPNSNF